MNCRVILILFTFFLLSPYAHAERTIRGSVFLSDGTAAEGYRVRAFDEDMGSDEQMCETRVNSSGNYSMTFRTGTWDGPKVGTMWRPDIYIVVARPLPDGGWRRSDQSGVRPDWTVRYDINHNFRLPDDGECPATAKFDTTGVWRGCKCALGSHKRWLDAAHYKARCEAGYSPEKACKVSGGTWVGYDNRYGKCIKEPDLPSVHRALRREAYYAYMNRVAQNVQLESLPNWVVVRYQSFYPTVKLNEVMIGESKNTPTSTTAITDCKKIYYPKGLNELPKIRSESTPNYFLLLHEIAHTGQCMSLNPGIFSSKRDKYADMWFSNLPMPTLLSILEDGVPADNSVHDKMPMEKDADSRAAQIVLRTGKGQVPANKCPTKRFSTREYRGCGCPPGTTKKYSGMFSEFAECKN